MNTAKIYHDSEGNECSILQVVKREPTWAAVRIQEGENAIEQLEKYKNVMEMAENFMTVRQIKGYDDRAHKSAGWYLCEAIKNLK